MSSIPPAVSAAIPDHWLLKAVLVTLGSVALLMFHAGLTVDLRGGIVALVSAGGLLLARGVYSAESRQRVRHRIARDAAEYIGLFAAIGLVGAVASYPDAAGSSGFVDARLQAIDSWLGFDWLAWYRVVAAHPVLQVSGRIAYAMVFITPALLLGYCAYTDRKAEARLFLGAFWLAAVLTLLLFHFVPAAGPLAFLWQGPIPYMPTSALYQAHLIPLLRHHSMHRINLVELRGLVCVPSFHAACAILYTLAAWPIARLRWPITLLNVAMLLATPVEGTHYLADMIAGAAVAMLAWAVMQTVTRRLERGMRMAQYGGVPSPNSLPKWERG